MEAGLTGNSPAASSSMQGVSEPDRGPAASPPSDSETSEANSRHALLVCISKYDYMEDCPDLPEAESAQRLQELGFKVTQLSNEEGRLTRESLQEGVQKFVDCVKQEATGERPVVFVLCAGCSRRVDGQLEMLTSDTNPGEEVGYKEEDLYGHLDELGKHPFRRRHQLQIIFIFDTKHIVQGWSKPGARQGKIRQAWHAARQAWQAAWQAGQMAKEPSIPAKTRGVRLHPKCHARQHYTIYGSTCQAPGRLTRAVMKLLAFKLPITRVLQQAAQEVAQESNTRERPYLSVRPDSRDPWPPSLGCIEFKEDAEWGMPSGEPDSSASSSRHSLLVCPSQYDGGGVHNLPGVSKDEADASRVLRELGFDVTSLSEEDGRVTRKVLEEGIRDFVERVQRTAAGDNPIVLIMFAGHSVQVGGQLHMLPSDATLDANDYSDDGYCEEDLKEKLDGITSRMKFQFHQRLQFIFILDTCREKRSSKLALKKSEATPKAFKNDFYTAYSCCPGGASSDTVEGGALVQAVLRWLPFRLEITTVLQMAAVDADPEGRFRPEVSMLPPPAQRPPVVGTLGLHEVSPHKRRLVEALTAGQEDYEWNSSAASSGLSGSSLTASQQEPGVQGREANQGNEGSRQTLESATNVTPTSPWQEPHTHTHTHTQSPGEAESRDPTKTPETDDTTDSNAQAKLEGTLEPLWCPEPQPGPDPQPSLPLPPPLPQPPQPLPLLDPEPSVRLPQTLPLLPLMDDNGEDLDLPSTSKHHTESESESQSKFQSGSGSQEASSRLEGRLTPTPTPTPTLDVNPKPEPEVFHAVTGPGGSLQPVSSGWDRLVPFERQDLEALEVWKSVTFKERNTRRSIQDMLQPETMALPMLLHWGMTLPAEVEVRMNGYDANFRAKFQEAVRFVRRFRLQEYPAEWVEDDKKANAVGWARQRVVVKGGEEGITVPGVHYLDWALNHLILAILGRDRKGKKPELILLDGTSDGEKAHGGGAGPGSGSGSYDHFAAASSSCGIQEEHLHLQLKLPPPDGSESEPSTLDTRGDNPGDGTHHASSRFCSSSGSGNSSNRSNSNTSSSGSAMKVCSTTQSLEPNKLSPVLPPSAPEQEDDPGPPQGSNARCCHVVMNCILEAMAKCVVTAADQRRDEATSASMNGKRPELVVFVADPPMPVMMGRVQGPEHESDNDLTAGTENEAEASLFPPTPSSSEEEQQGATASLFPPTPWSSEGEQQEVPFLLDVFLPQDGEHG